MKICSVCQHCYEDTAAGCLKNHGTLLNERAGTREMVNNYRLNSLLERDETGENYLATRANDNQPVVIRIVAQNLIIGAGEAARQQFQREAQAAVSLDHPNINRVLDSGTLQNGEFYVVTESVAGRTLQECLRDFGSLSEAEAVKIAGQTAEALAAAHNAGIIHRAVSPANILLTRDANKKLTVKLKNFDFGGFRQQIVARNANIQTKIDTLRYLSPEQYEKKSVDAQTDVYSLGIVLYEMLCGRSPFAAPTSESIVDRRINEEPLAQLRFDIRALLTHTVKEAMQKKPSARLQIGNFARQLRHIAQLILPLGETLPETPPISTPDKTVISTPISAEPLGNEQFQQETIMSEKIDTTESTAMNLIGNSSNAEKIEEFSTGKISPLGEMAPVFVIKSDVEVDSATVEPVQSENLDATIGSPATNPIFSEREQVNELPFEPDVEEMSQTTAREMPLLGELAPVFILKNQHETDSLPADSIAVEDEKIHNDSYESNPVIEKNRFDEVQFQSNAARTDEVTTVEIPRIGEFAPVFVGKDQDHERAFESEPPTVSEQEIAHSGVAREVSVLPAENIKHTRKAESAAPVFTGYSNENLPPRRVSPANRSALVGAGLIAILISIMFGAYLYNRRNQSAVAQQTTVAVASPSTQTSDDVVSDSNTTAKTVQPDAPETSSSASIPARQIPQTASKRPDQKLPEETAAINNAPRRDEPIQDKVMREKTAAADGKPQAELKNALDDWISATNSRDVEQQMNYYAPKLNTYYQTRNTSQGAVRAEKNRVFARADAVDIQTGKPDIALSPDGQRATMRFRKKYSIKQGQQNRNGEVIQELQWVKSGGDWRIVSERDIRVINR